jgi:hypothetical protein
VTVAAGRITVGFGAAAGAAGDVDEFSHAILKARGHPLGPAPASAGHWGEVLTRICGL